MIGHLSTLQKKISKGIKMNQTTRKHKAFNLKLPFTLCYKNVIKF